MFVLFCISLWERTTCFIRIQTSLGMSSPFPWLNPRGSTRFFFLEKEYNIHYFKMALYSHRGKSKANNPGKKRREVSLQISLSLICMHQSSLPTFPELLLLELIHPPPSFPRPLYHHFLDNTLNHLIIITSFTPRNIRSSRRVFYPFLHFLFMFFAPRRHI